MDGEPDTWYIQGSFRLSLAVSFNSFQYRDLSCHRNMPQQIQLLFPRSTPTRSTALPGARLKHQQPSPLIEQQNGRKSDQQRTPSMTVAACKGQNLSQNPSPSPSKPLKPARRPVFQGLLPTGRHCDGLLLRKTSGKTVFERWRRLRRQPIVRRLARTRRQRESEPLFPSCCV